VCGSADSTEDAVLEVQIQNGIRQFLLSKCKTPTKFQFVGLQQLGPLLEQLKVLAKNKGFELQHLLLGGGSQLFYDCPKVPEAFIRIARRHKKSPVFRFDADVYVDQNSVQNLLKMYEDLVKENKLYFFFSGTYFFHDRRKEPVEFYLNDYSVRTHFLSKGPNGEDYKSCVDAPHLKYELDVELTAKFINGLPLIGAAPAGQPISGAGLCISPLAIVQLPPFANMSKNIVWIDDSIKRYLHEGLKDLNADDPSVVDSAKFRQDRYPAGIFGKDANWAYENYIPRLIHGCLIHSLMHAPGNPAIPGPYAVAAQTYMCKNEKPAIIELESWSDIAKERITKIAQQWGSSVYNTPAGKIIYDIAQNELNITPSAQQLLDDFLRDPSKEIGQLCSKHGFKDDRNAGGYIAY